MRHFSISKSCSAETNAKLAKADAEFAEFEKKYGAIEESPWCDPAPASLKDFQDAQRKVTLEQLYAKAYSYPEGQQSDVTAEFERLSATSVMVKEAIRNLEKLKHLKRV